MSTFNYNSGSSHISYTGSFSEIDQKIWWDVMPNHASSKEWIQNTVQAKLDRTYKLMQRKWVPILLDDPNVNAISASKEDLVNQVITHSSYKTAYEQQVSGSL